jgi:biotin carboxyl carrier protein
MIEGVVEKLLVSVGQSVAAGDTLLTVSAMKMEVKVTAPADGLIASIHVEVGARVVDGALLVCMK